MVIWEIVYTALFLLLFYLSFYIQKIEVQRVPFFKKKIKAKDYCDSCNVAIQLLSVQHW